MLEAPTSSSEDGRSALKLEVGTSEPEHSRSHRWLSADPGFEALRRVNESTGALLKSDVGAKLVIPLQGGVSLKPLVE